MSNLIIEKDLNHFHGECGKELIRGIQDWKELIRDIQDC